MKTISKSVLILALGILLVSVYAFPPSFAVIQGHRPMVIQGHSPIYLSVTFDGKTSGCVQNSQGKWVSETQIPGSTFSGCNSEPETIHFNNALNGVWLLTWVGKGSIPITTQTTAPDTKTTRTTTVTSTTTSTTGSPFTITADTCASNQQANSIHKKGHPVLNCRKGDHDPQYVLVTGTIVPGQIGDFSFTNTNGILSPIFSTPEFPSFVPGVFAIFGAFGAYWYFGVRRRSI